MAKELSAQAKNSLRDLYKGAPIASIKQAFQFQRKICEELKGYFGISDIDALAARCQRGL